ncbi:MAG: PspA/IM30 family protein [Chloroflexi bacterium]|nr:PspA/IM30 family protein [Chloroflexota bacterium]
MASLLEKVNTLISANLHAIVDAALEANSLKVIDEHIRQAERNLEELEDTAATIGGTAKTLRRKYDELQQQIEKLDRDIDTLLMKEKNDLAMAAQSDLNNKQKIAQEYYDQWQTQEQEYKGLLDARLKLEARLQFIRQQREQLKALMELTEAKHLTTKAIRRLDDLAGLGDEDIARLSEEIRGRLDRAEVEQEMVSNRLRSQIDDSIGKTEIELQLEDRRKRLGLGGEAS